MNRRNFLKTTGLGASVAAMPALAVGASKPVGFTIGDNNAPHDDWCEPIVGFPHVAYRRKGQEIAYLGQWDQTKIIEDTIDRMIAMFRRETGYNAAWLRAPDSVCNELDIKQSEASFYLGFPGREERIRLYKGMNVFGLMADNQIELLGFGTDGKIKLSCCSAALPPGLRGPITIRMER